jgi:hypothetical protein
MRKLKISAVIFLFAGSSIAIWLFGAHGQAPAPPSFWQIYNQAFAKAKYVDLTHTITPSIPVWAGPIGRINRLF